MTAFGLIGYPLEQSFSPDWFKHKFKQEQLSGCTYQSFPLASIHELPQLLEKEPDLKGLNVTIPYKQSVIPFLDKLSPEAIAVGAVNTISLEKGKWVGYNTDIVGFRESLEPVLKKQHTRALVLGTGGASLAVCFVLKQLGITYRIVSRNPHDNQLSYQALDPVSLNFYPLIINTTPLGMHPNVSRAPELPYEALNEHHLLYDLVYNPIETLFLKQGKARGSAIKNGMEMLQRQAEASWRIWQK